MHGSKQSCWHLIVFHFKKDTYDHRTKSFNNFLSIQNLIDFQNNMPQLYAHKEVFSQLKYSMEDMGNINIYFNI